MNERNRNEWDRLPESIQNPFSVMRRWLRFELMDLESVLQAIDKKNEMDKRRQSKIKERDNDMEELQKMKEGRDTFMGIFRSKEGKISKITELTNSIQAAESDIECLSLLHKITVLALNQAAIQFFKREKFTTYNHTVNLYAAKVLENATIKENLFFKLSEISKEATNKISTKKAKSLYKSEDLYRVTFNSQIFTDIERAENLEWEKEQTKKGTEFKVVPQKEQIS